VITNAAKLVPYIALGELNTGTLLTSVIFIPVAILSTWLGAWIVHRLQPQVFYSITYGSVALIGCKLIWDGVKGL
jgi:uncharacterized protein